MPKTKMTLKLSAMLLLLAALAMVGCGKKANPSSINTSSASFSFSGAGEGKDAERKKTAEAWRDALKATTRSLDGQIASFQQLANGPSTPLMAQVYATTLADMRQRRDNYQQQVKEVEEVIAHWETWGKDRRYAWEASTEAAGSGLSAASSSSSYGYGNHTPSRQCRTCGVCSGRGSVGPFGNAYSGAGYRPAQTCSNCGGSGTVCY